MFMAPLGLYPQSYGQCGPSVMQMYPDGRFGTAQDVGDLGIGVVFEVPQGQDLGLAAGQGTYRTPEIDVVDR